MTSAVDDLDWEVLLQSLAQHECVALLGPNLHWPNGDPATPKLVTELAHHIAEKLDDDDRKKIGDPDDLALVAQVYLDATSRQTLEIVVRRFYENHQASLSNGHDHDPMFETLAGLPFRLFICSRQDKTLEHFLEAQGKTPVAKAYNFNGDPDTAVGECNSDDAPVVYHLFGAPDEPRSLALTQRDRFDLLKAIVSGSPGLPNDLLNQIKQKSFLFLGCGLNDYYLRMLLHVLGLNDSKRTSFGLDEPNEESVWFYKVEYKKLKLLNIEAPDFVQELGRRWKDYDGGVIRPKVVIEDRPRVFISYVRKDEDWMNDIKQTLDTHEINTWVDVEGIRGGDNWEHKIEKAIDKQVDFFMVLVGENFNDHVRSFAHLEVRAALYRRAQLPGIKFIYALRINGKEERLVALDREKIHTQQIDDVATDLAGIATDIKREYSKLKRR